MFAFSQTEPNTTGRLSRWDVPINRWLGVKFGDGYDSTIGVAWERKLDDWFADGDLLTPEQANERYKLPTLKFDEPVREQEAHLRYERKRQELARLSYMEAATHSVLSGKALAGFGATLLGGLAHPIDAATIFLPIVGSAARANAAGKAGDGPIRQALARGLITEEGLANFSKFPKFTAAVVEGTVGQAIVEVPVYLQKRKDSAIYGIEDALFNVAAGGAFAGAIHAGAKGLSRIIERTARAHAELTPEIKELLLKEHISAFAEGRDPNVRDFVQVDENAIRAKVVFDETRAQQEAMMEVPGAKPFDPDWRVTVQEPQPHPSGETVPGYTQIDIIEDGKNVRSTNIDALQKEGFAIPDLEGLRQGQYKLGEAVSIVNGNAVKDIELKMSAERSARVQEVIARKKQEFEATKETRVKAEMAAEISRQQSEGKLLSQPMVDEYTKAPGKDTEAGSFLDNDISTLEQDLKADNDRRVVDLDEAEKASLQEELDAELKAVEEEAYEPKDKAVDAAMPCVMEALRNG
jgi:hypothetical protein